MTMTSIARRRAGFREGVLLTVGFVLAIALGAATVPPQPTDAAWISEESGTLSATAETVPEPATTCVGNNSAPNLLHLDAPEEGAEVTAYRVTILVQDGDDADALDDEVPAAWQSGQTSQGYPLLPANTPTVVPASTSTVAWGIAQQWSYTWRGEVRVEALGPGGWTSGTVTHDWSIGFTFLGTGYGSCR